MKAKFRHPMQSSSIELLHLRRRWVAVASNGSLDFAVHQLLLYKATLLAMLNMLAILFLLTGGGCNRSVASRDDSAATSSQPAHDALHWIDLSKQAYLHANAYSDAGFVRLTYQLSGQTYEDRAPLAVRYQAPNQIDLNAYTVRLTSDGQHLQAMIADPDTNHLDGQCLRVEASPKLSLAQVYADPVVAQFAGAGMGGPAPQLELLLSDQPLAAWLQGPGKRSVGEDQTIDGHRCKSIVITMQDLRYVLCIDEEDYLIRRVELPWQAIAPDLASNPYLSNASLTIELADAQFHRTLDDAPFVAQQPPLTVAVSELILPPPEAPHPLVGQQASAFTLRDSNGRFELSSQQNSRPANILLWVADHSSSQQVAVAFQRTIERLPNETLENVRAAIVMAEPNPNDSTGNMLRRWGIGLPWIDDTQAVGRDVFQITEAPCLIVISADGKIELHQQRVSDSLMQAIPSILASVEQKQPVGRIAQENYVASQARYFRSIAQGSGLQFPLSQGSLVLASGQDTELRWK